MSTGKHRKKNQKRAITTAAVMGAATVLPVVFASQQAVAAPNSTVWDKLANCESSGNFSNRDTGNNGHYGGFQFSPATWVGVGGKGNPADASPAEQLKRAKILLAQSGPSQWECKVGLTRQNGAAQGLTILGSATTKAAPAKPKSTGVTKGQLAAQFAERQIGKSYVYGATGPNTFDCSGLTQAAWKAAGVNIPRTSEAQWSSLSKVSLTSLQKGDLIISQGGGHIAIYVGNGNTIDAPRPGKSVRKLSLRTYDQYNNVVGAVRPAGSGTVIAPPAKPKTQPVPKVTETPKAPEKTVPGDKYAVVSGDTLSGIATAQSVDGGWHALYANNKGVVGDNPNLIYPGQNLTVPGTSKAEKPATTPELARKSAPAPKEDIQAPVKKATGWVSPVPGHVSTGWNVKGSSWSSGRHTGIDFHANQGTSVKAVHQGIVVSAGWSGAYGNEVIIQHKTSFGTYYTQYAHMSSISVRKGGTVSAGTVIGRVGATGNASGPHLHFEVRNKATYGSDINPVPFLRAQGLKF